MRWRGVVMLTGLLLLMLVVSVRAQQDTTFTWVAQYYDNRDLSGQPAAIQADDAPNHEWGTGAPLPGMRANNFSARWYASPTLEAGTYLISVQADDGVRVYVDNLLVIDEWHDATGQTYSSELDLNAGQHLIIVEYYEQADEAFIRFNFQNTEVEIAQSGGPVLNSEQWIAQYYNNPNLEGLPAVIQAELSPNHNWGAGRPVGSVGANRFSVRWTGQTPLSAGRYRLSVRADDGVRVYVDGNLVIDEWHDTFGQTYTSEMQLSGGLHTFIVEYYENTGDAFISYNLMPLGVVVPTATPAVAPGQWLAEYFNNTDLSGAPALTRAENTPNHNWGISAPALGVNPDNFSVRFTSTQALAGGNYRLSVRADDGVRVFVDGQRLIDEWHDATGATYTVNTFLNAGNHVFRIEFFEVTGAAFLNYELTPLGSVPGVVTITPAAPPPVVITPSPPSDTWIAYYYNNRELAGSPASIFSEANPSHNWGRGAPPGIVNPDNFSARWTRVQQFDSGTYRISVTADDGVRVYVDGALVIDEWHDTFGQSYTADVTLQAGQHTLTIEFYEARGDAFLEFEIDNAAETPRYTGATATVGQYRLNVRDIPTTENSAVVAKINPNTTYQIVGTNPSQTWWQVDVEGTFGWVFGNYVRVANTGNVPVTVAENIGQPPSTGYRASALTDVNIRRGANVRDDLLGTLPGGAQAAIVGRNSNSSWWQINYNGVIGWVIAGAVSVQGVGDAAQVPVTG